MAVCRGGKRRPRRAKVIHQEETQANWMTVRVMGWGKALRMVLEDVFVSAELMYQIRQRTWTSYERLVCIQHVEDIQ